MRRFHILYKEKPTDEHTQGENIDSKDILNALLKFKKTHKGIEPVYIEDKGDLKEFENKLQI